MFDSLKRLAARAALAAGVLACCAFAAAATDPRFTFTNVVDTGTPVPGSGTPGRFAGFSDIPIFEPAADAGSVVFVGRSDQGRRGVYRWTDGQLSVVADTTFTTDAGGQDRFVEFRHPVVSGPSVAFLGSGTQSGGLYLARGNELTRVAAPGMSAPDGLGTFTSAGIPTLWNDEVSFRGNYTGSPSGTGIFRYSDGAIHTVVRTGQPIPGGNGTFNFFFDPLGGGGELVFRGSGNGRDGLFRTSGNRLERVIEGFMPLPDNAADSIGNIGPWADIDGSQTGFLLYEDRANRYSIWTERDGQFVRRATGGQPVPGGSGELLPFDTETMISLDADHVAFEARTDPNGVWSLFTDLGGQFTRVIGPGDTLSGKEVAAIRAGPDSLSGRGIAFAAFFRDGSVGMYVATVPEPGAWALAAAAGSLALLARRRPRGAT